MPRIQHLSDIQFLFRKFKLANSYLATGPCRRTSCSKYSCFPLHATAAGERSDSFLLHRQVRTPRRAALCVQQVSTVCWLAGWLCWLAGAMLSAACRYMRVSQDKNLDTFRAQAIESLLKPLYVTSWLCDDFLSDNGFFGAEQVSRPARVFANRWRRS